MCLFRESCRLKKRVKLAYPNMILNIIKPYFCKIDRVNGSCVVLARFSSGKEFFSIKRNYAACLAEYLCKSLCFHRLSVVPCGGLIITVSFGGFCCVLHAVGKGGRSAKRIGVLHPCAYNLHEAMKIIRSFAIRSEVFLGSAYNTVTLLLYCFHILCFCLFISFLSALPYFYWFRIFASLDDGDGLIYGAFE